MWRAVPRHPHILQFYGACKITRQWYYAVPYLHLSPMLVYLYSYPEADRGALVLQVCDALKALHASNIVHGQVGITKLLVTGNRALLYDFCQSRTQGQGFEEDVFDFGVTIAEVRWAHNLVRSNIRASHRSSEGSSTITGFFGYFEHIPIDHPGLLLTEWHTVRSGTSPVGVGGRTLPSARQCPKYSTLYTRFWAPYVFPSLLSHRVPRVLWPRPSLRRIFTTPSR